MSVLLTSSFPPPERVEGLEIGNTATYLRIEPLTEEEFLRRLLRYEFDSAVGHRPLALYLASKLGREVNYSEDDLSLRLGFDDILFVARVRGLRNMQRSVSVQGQIWRVERAVRTFYQVSNATIMAAGGHDHC